MEDLFSWMNDDSASLETDAFPVGMLILVVDDNQAYLKKLEIMLEACSYKVTACNSTRGALELLQGSKHAFDILITEVHMPDMDGFQLLEHVGRKFDLPVILMSYDGAMGTVSKGVELKASEYILKPLRMEELRYIWQHVQRKWIREVKEIESYGDIFAGFFSNEECPASPLIKRKQMNEEHDADLTNPAKRARVIWTRDSVDKFVHAAEDRSFTSSGSIAAGSSQENFSFSDNSRYTHPDEVIQAGCSISFADLDIPLSGYDQWFPISTTPCR